MAEQSSRAQGGGGRFLVAYATKRGSTREIAEELSTALEQDGFDVTVSSAAEVGDVAPYDAVVLGSSVYLYRWHRAARRFVRAFATALAGRSVWLFSTGPLDDSASTGELAPGMDAMRAATQLAARGHRTFGDRLDPGTPGRLARSMASRGAEGDYRDMDQVRAWAHAIAAQVRQERADA
jgi:menaquinone-dependent protoporphyrinogen oxidase